MFSKVSQCQYKPCKNGATCIDLKDDFMCRCTTDYVGKICDRKLVFNVLIHCILFFINKINMSLTWICRQNSGKENKFPKKYQKHWATYLLWIFTLKSKYRIANRQNFSLSFESVLLSFFLYIVRVGLCDTENGWQRFGSNCYRLINGTKASWNDAM